MSRAPLVLLLLVVVGDPPAVATGAAPIGANDRRVAAGEIVVRREAQPARGPGEVVGVAIIEAPPERVFAALEDHRHYPEWVPFMVRSAARRSPGGGVLHDQILDLPRPLGDRHYTVLARSSVEQVGATPTRWRISWELVPGSGNVRRQRGGWTLEPAGSGGTLAACRLLVDPGGLAPPWAVDRAAARAMRWLFDGLRQQVRRWRYDPANPTGKELGEE